MCIRDSDLPTFGKPTIPAVKAINLFLHKKVIQLIITQKLLKIGNFPFENQKKRSKEKCYKEDD